MLRMGTRRLRQVSGERGRQEGGGRWSSRRRRMGWGEAKVSWLTGTEAESFHQTITVHIAAVHIFTFTFTFIFIFTLPLNTTLNTITETVHLPMRPSASCVAVHAASTAGQGARRRQEDRGWESTRVWRPLQFQLLLVVALLLAQLQLLLRSMLQLQLLLLLQRLVLRRWRL